LAERHPELAAAIEAIDAQLAKLGTAEVIRADDWASFLGIDPNQVSAVLEKLAHEGLLCAQEMVECAYCRMAALRSEYLELQEEDGEYRCTSCDRPLTDATVEVVTTYRRGEGWNEDSSTGTDSCDAEPSRIKSLDDNAWYTHDQLADAFGVPKDALRKRLDRYRQSNLWGGWKEQTERRPREPKYLYRLKAVRGIIENLRASSERPAK